MTDGKYTYHGEHRVMYGIVKSVSYVPKLI